MQTVSNLQMKVLHVAPVVSTLNMLKPKTVADLVCEQKTKKWSLLQIGSVEGIELITL